MKKSTKFYLEGTLICVLFILFTLLIKNVDVKAIGPNGSSVGMAGFNGLFARLFKFNQTWLDIADRLGIIALGIVGFFAVVGLIQWIKRKNMLKVDGIILTLGGLYLVTLFLYFISNVVAINYRPILMDGVLEPSYPSSHTVLALVVFGSAMHMINHYLKNGTLKTGLKMIMLTLMILTICSRLFSGAHWMTDIIAALLLAATLLAFFKGTDCLIKEKAQAKENALPEEVQTN